MANLSLGRDKKALFLLLSLLNYSLQEVCEGKIVLIFRALLPVRGKGFEPLDLYRNGS